MQNGDEASPSIIVAGQALLVKMLIPLEPHDAYGSNFVYLCIIHKSCAYCYNVLSPLSEKCVIYSPAEEPYLYIVYQQKRAIPFIENVFCIFAKQG